MAEKNYYEILGVDKNATEDDIKKAYRKLSLQWHPDRHVNDSPEEQKKAEEKFKEISEAYTCLSDSDKRRQYDSGGQNPFGPGGFDMGDFMRRHFGGGFPGFGGGFGGFNRGERTSIGDDVDVSVDISLKEAYSGVKKTITYKRNVSCKHCNGTGSADGKVHTCSYCNGTGMVTKTQQTAFGFASVSSPCPHCHGTGKGSSADKCSHCHGTGFESETRSVVVDLPSGLLDGVAVSVAGEGNAPAGGKGQYGNLIVHCHISDYNGFEMEPGSINLNKELEISLSESLLGCKRTIECPDGKTISVDINKPTANGTIFTFSGKGMPHPNYNSHYGDLFVKIKVKLPNSLSEKQKEIVNMLKENGM